MCSPATMPTRFRSDPSLSALRPRLWGQLLTSCGIIAGSLPTKPTTSLRGTLGDRRVESEVRFLARKRHRYLVRGGGEGERYLYRQPDLNRCSCAENAMS